MTESCLNFPRHIPSYEQLSVTLTIFDEDRYLEARTNRVGQIDGLKEADSGFEASEVSDKFVIDIMLFQRVVDDSDCDRLVNMERVVRGTSQLIFVRSTPDLRMIEKMQFVVHVIPKSFRFAEKTGLPYSDRYCPGHLDCRTSAISSQNNSFLRCIDTATIGSIIVPSMSVAHKVQPAHVIE